MKEDFISQVIRDCDRSGKMYKNQIIKITNENILKTKEIERLNNIIEGMENFIIHNLDYWNKESSQRSSLIKETLTNTLDTLRKLKGKK